MTTTISVAILLLKATGVNETMMHIFHGLVLNVEYGEWKQGKRTSRRDKGQTVIWFVQWGNNGNKWSLTKNEGQ